MSEFLEDLEISSVYLAPALNKDDLSSSVRDNRSSNETLTQKQMFSEAKIILSHRVNFSLVVPWKNLFVRCFATCANGKRAGVEKLWILEKFRILHIDRVYISQISSKMKFNIIERKEEERGGKKWTKRERDQGYRCSDRLFLNATSSKTERSFFRRMYSRDVSSIHPATRTTIASTLLFLVACANYATLHAETERLHAVSLEPSFHSSHPPEIP